MNKKPYINITEEETKMKGTQSELLSMFSELVRDLIKSGISKEMLEISYNLGTAENQRKFMQEHIKKSLDKVIEKLETLVKDSN